MFQPRYAFYVILAILLDGALIRADEPNCDTSGSDGQWCCDGCYVGCEDPWEAGSGIEASLNYGEFTEIFVCDTIRICPDMWDWDCCRDGICVDCPTGDPDQNFPMAYCLGGLDKMDVEWNIDDSCEIAEEFYSNCCAHWTDEVHSYWISAKNLRLRGPGTFTVTALIQDGACGGESSDDEDVELTATFCVKCNGPDSISGLPRSMCPGQAATVSASPCPCDAGRSLAWEVIPEGGVQFMKAESGTCNDSMELRILPESASGKLIVRAMDADAPGCYVESSVEVGCSGCTDCGHGTTDPRLSSGRTIQRSSERYEEEECNSCVPPVSGPVFDLPLGSGTDDIDLGLGSLYFESPRPTSELSDAVRLAYSGPDGSSSTDAHVIRYNDAIAQVKTPDILVEIDNPGGNIYRVRVYTLKTTKTAWTYYPPPVDRYDPGDGDLFQTWRIQHTDSPANYVLKFTKINGNDGTSPDVIASYEFTYTGASAVSEDWGWILKVRNDANTVMRQTNDDWDWNGTTGVWTRTWSISERDSDDVLGLVQKKIEIWKDFGVGPQLMQRIIDPDDVALTSTFSYYADGLIESVENADGSWSWFKYESPTGYWTQTEINGWLDAAMPGTLPSPTASSVRSIEYKYHASGTYAGHLSSMKKYIASNLVARTDHSYSTPSGVETVTTSHCLDGSCSSYLTTVTELDDWDGDPITITHPDGRKDVFENDVAGDFDKDIPEFDPDSGGKYRQSTVKHFAVAYPSGVSGKSTWDSSVRDPMGRRVLNETWNYDGTERLSWIQWKYDRLGRVTEVKESNGRITETTYSDCCGSQTLKDASGIETVYTVDPVLHRTVTQAKIASTNLVTDFLFTIDSGSNERTETVEIGPSGGTPLDSSRIYGLSGRLLSETDQSDAITAYDYDVTAQGGRKITATHPGGITEITEHYLDGQIKRRSGTGLVEQRYSYASASGERSTTTTTGPSASTRTNTTARDMLGRTKREERPAFDSGTPLSTTYTYSGTTGQLLAVDPPDQYSTLYSYDELGAIKQTVLDIDNDSVIDGAGPDRINQVETVYDNLGGSDYWRVTTSKTCFTNSSSTLTTVSARNERLTGFSGSTVAEVHDIQFTDSTNLKTITTTTINRSTKTVTVSVDEPDSTISADTITVNGLHTQTNTKTGYSIGYVYDGFGRRTEVNDPRFSNNIITAYSSSTGQVTSITDADGKTTTYDYVASNAKNAGRVATITNALNKVTRFAYTDRGESWRVWGDVPQPVEFASDDYGQRITMATYQSGTWNGADWPGSPPAANVTTWAFDGSTGLLTTKTYADATAVSYDYSSTTNQLTSRTWARNSSGSGVTSYEYFGETGELKKIDYPSGTTDVTFTYLRTGQLDTVQDTAGTRTFTYTAHRESWQEKFDSSFYSSKWITHGYATTVVGRLTQLQVGTSSTANADYEANYTYDTTTSRMSRVTGPGLPSSGTTPGISYRYATGSDLVKYLVLRNGSANKFWSHREFENERNLLDKVENYFGDVDNQGSSTEISTYNYTNDDLGRRTVCNHTGSAFTTFDQQFDYDDRNELTYSKRPISSPAKQWTYVYDPIGNRTQSVENLGTGNKSTDYERNGVNQYPASELSSPHTSQGYRYDDDGNLIEMFIAGDMNCDGSVNNLDTAAMSLAVSNPTQWHTLYPSCNILNGDFDGDGDVDADDQTLLAGVLTGGTANATLMNYTYDAENRLIKVEPPNPSGAGIFLKSEFKYDYMGRRIEKKVWQWASGSWGSPITHAKYVWDGWLLLEELNGLSSNAVTKKYTWGLDLAGLNGSVNDRTSAGGIGGVLAMRIVSGSKDYCYLYDGNGNVGQLVEWSLTSNYVKAKYEYDPYGSRANSGSGEPANDFRFSTKVLDSETGLYYYGYRYYNPKLGRWMNRDPLSEQPDVLVYRSMRNNPVVQRDALGLCASNSTTDCSDCWKTCISVSGQALGKGDDGWVICRPDGCQCACANQTKYPSDGDLSTQLLRKCALDHEEVHVKQPSDSFCSFCPECSTGLERKKYRDPFFCGGEFWAECEAYKSELFCLGDALTECKEDQGCRGSILNEISALLNIACGQMDCIDLGPPFEVRLFYGDSVYQVLKAKCPRQRPGFDPVIPGMPRQAIPQTGTNVP